MKTLYKFISCLHTKTWCGLYIKATSRVAPQFIDDSIIGRVQWRGNLRSSARLVSIMRREENILAGSSCDWRSLVLRRGSQRERQSPEYQSGNLISSGLSFNFSALSISSKLVSCTTRNTPFASSRVCSKVSR